MLKIAGRVLGRKAELVLGRFEDPLPAGPFDLIVSSLAVHHLDRVGKADLFGRIAKRLTWTGRFVMGDVVVTEAAVAEPAPLDRLSTFPDRIDDLLDLLGRAGLRPKLCWAEATSPSSRPNRRRGSLAKRPRRRHDNARSQANSERCCV